MVDGPQIPRFRFWLWLIRVIGVIVPRRLRADWRQEWESELRNREALLEEWDRLDWRGKIDLLRRSASAFWDALWLQPRRWEDEMIQDLRYGARTLLKNPGFTLVATLSLALGIGANAAIFSLLDAVLLKPLPVRRPEQLVFLEQGEREYKPTSNISYAAFERLRDRSQSLSGACFFSFSPRVNAGVNGQVEVVEAQLVSGGFFSTLGVGAAAGRMFTEAEDQDAGAAVAVISHQYWRRRFGMNPSAVAAVGQTVTVNGAPFTVVGVTPPEFSGVIAGISPDIYLPSASGERILPRRFRFRDGSLPFVLARMKPSVSERQAIADLTLLLRQALFEEAGARATPEKGQDIQNRSMRLLPASQGFSVLRRQYSEPLWLLMAVVGLVLLIACANVANLLLARAASRGKEIAVRLALGASRLRLIRQLLTESLLLALLGGAAGLLLAWRLSGLLLAVFSSGRNPVTAGSSLTLNVPLDGRVVGFTAVVSLLAVVLFGLAPAWRATRIDLTPTLKDGARDSRGGRFRWGRALVVAQVALSLTLLVGAGLFIRSLIKLKSADLGFRRENVLLFSVDPQLTGYQRDRIAGLYKQLLERVATVPGVRSVSLSRQGLLNGGGTQGSITVPGRPPKADENGFTQTREDTEWNAPWFCQVGPRFFETVGMTILRGRDFGPQDNETARKVAVVNEAFARYYFGDEDPVGQQFDRGQGDGGLMEIIGVVKDAKSVNIRETTPRTFYVPFLQDPGSWRETTFQVRAAGDPLPLVAAIRREAQGVDPNLPLFRVRTLEAQVDESLGQERLVALLAGLFGALALLLACAGLYGVLSYSVSRRTREIGVRMAIGAPPGRVLRMILVETYSLALAGVAIGAAISLAAGRLIANMLFGLTPNDPITLLSAVLIMLGVASLAGLLPARKASRVAPMVALRQE
jgi:predicted permease